MSMKSREWFRTNWLSWSTLVVLVSFSKLANAQSSVTLYGVIDTGILYTSRSVDSTGHPQGHKFAMSDGGIGGSRFGFQGKEDLGGGWKAIFRLESGISPSTGGFANSNRNFFGRWAYVGLDGPYGTVKAGLQYSPFAIACIVTDPRGANYFGSGAVVYVGNVFVTGLFNSNAVSYVSPIIGGFQGSAMVALGGQAGNFRSGSQYSARLNYTQGPVKIDVAWYDGQPSTGAPVSPTPSTVEFEGRIVGVSYTWEKVTLKANVTNLKVANSFNTYEYEFGGNYSIRPDLYFDAGVWIVRDGNNSENHSVLTAAGLQYLLSARTSLYTSVAYVNNHGKMNTGVATNGALFGAPGSTTGVILGMTHAF
ncbi:porin [Paraburkholderia caribensis]|uniref:porin n=1 Tax=Paraburkholderia caribensis TaxID=75105 RepID=UPI0034472AB1